MDKELLKEDSKISSMRWALVQVIRMSFIIILCTGAYIIINSIRCDTIDWSGIGIMLAGLTAFIGAAVTGKYFQKKEENKS
jgi:uncharacterized membrane protein